MRYSEGLAIPGVSALAQVQGRIQDLRRGGSM